MAKNIVILLDGTSNQISGDRTNVLRLYGSLERSKKQLVFYQPGVGTFGLSGWWQQWRSKLRIIMGLATGAGIAENVMEAYEFLVRNHEYGDKIYIFGFSRGSYTARLLAGFIRIFGLVRAEQLQLVRYAWRAYARLGQPGSKVFSAEIGHFQKVLGGHGVRIEFLGLWDTVASVFDARSGFPWLTTTQKAYTNQNNRVKIVRHAVAIDEQRTYFQPSLWEPGQDYEEWSRRKKAFVKTPQDFEEVWFTGCHGDVGGGYPDARSGLAKIPLEWLYREAEAAGIIGDEKVFELLVHGKRPGGSAEANEELARDEATKRTKDYAGPDPLADINQSMRGGWLIAEFLPRKIPATAFRIRFRLGKFYIPLFDHRKIPEGAKLHEAVIERLDKRPDYKPPNLPATYEVVKTRAAPALPPKT
ncbi:T6SS phospholipase effector Tle1-like catalytic domain-containing protein [Hoeflea sp.]|uniref:T6SS phospholipase effector Tle1-like catalytic domain-containing protein n=1 Tax=Hoeflea sp. TaxID=1940281 RepID=UPI003747BCC0